MPYIDAICVRVVWPANRIGRKWKLHNPHSGIHQHANSVPNEIPRPIPLRKMLASLPLSPKNTTARTFYRSQTHVLDSASYSPFQVFWYREMCANGKTLLLHSHDSFRQVWCKLSLGIVDEVYYVYIVVDSRNLIDRIICFHQHGQLEIIKKLMVRGWC